MAFEAITEEQALASWADIAHRAQELVNHGQRDEPVWPVAAGSPLAEDDRRSHPFRISHAATVALGAAVDHLHTLTTLVVDTRTLHTRGDFTLARGCLENAAYALWIVHPTRRSERLAHGLSWYATDIRDGDAACDELGIPRPKDLDSRIAELKEVANRAGVDESQALRQLRATQVMKYADAQVSGRPGDLGALFPWRLCSGFAHGRGWASLGALAQERLPHADEGVTLLRQTSSLDRILYPALAGLRLLDAAIETYQERAINHLSA